MGVHRRRLGTSSGRNFAEWLAVLKSLCFFNGAVYLITNLISKKVILNKLHCIML